ncbi:MAG: YggS family pyridoxal phosphate-dependent enzyme [Gammaproteobacteria bacterium]|nr:MAG: YggS family pyridoxal phosphate-dependent enzyme [Gammaproteobacteria bacterium]
MNEPAERLQQVRERIRRAALGAGRDPGTIGLVAVGKTRPATALAALAAAGQRRFGENYLQEALEKVEALTAPGLEWHFIGPVQSNKTRPVATRFHWLHSLDRLRIARRLSEQRPPELEPLQVCIQVNISGEATKAGVALAELPALAREVAALPRLRLRGLMALPAPEPDPRRQREPFARLREALEALNREGFDLDTLSMGTSSDLEAAIAEGATLVRIGTALFGPR